MIQARQLSWAALGLNTGLNVFGLCTVFSCNVWRQGCELIIVYCYGILFLGPPLFLMVFWLAPAGTFRANAAPRWLLLFNLGIGALLLALMLKVLFS